MNYSRYIYDNIFIVVVFDYGEETGTDTQCQFLRHNRNIYP